MSTDPIPTPTPSPSPDPEQLICYCFQVTEKEIEDAIRIKGLKSTEEINEATQAGCGCHTCWPDLEEILQRCAKGEYKFWPGQVPSMPAENSNSSTD